MPSSTPGHDHPAPIGEDPDTGPSRVDVHPDSRRPGNESGPIPRSRATRTGSDGGSLVDRMGPAPTAPVAAPQRAATGHRSTEPRPARVTGRRVEPTLPASGVADPARDALSSAALLRSRRSVAPLTGWRRALRTLTFGAVEPGPSTGQLRRDAQVATVRTAITGTHRVAVISLKGGVGKTTTTMMLGSTLASLRGDRVIALDANPDAGTLGDRLPRRTPATIRDLLTNYPQIRSWADLAAYTSQAASRLEVIANDVDPSVSTAITAADYLRVVEMLGRYYSVVLTDSGTGLLHDAMNGILNAADTLVLVSSASVDGARSASTTLDWLDAQGYGTLVASAVTVVSSVRPGGRDVDVDAIAGYSPAGAGRSSGSRSTGTWRPARRRTSTRWHQRPARPFSTWQSRSPRTSTAVTRPPAPAFEAAPSPGDPRGCGYAGRHTGRTVHNRTRRWRLKARRRRRRSVGSRHGGGGAGHRGVSVSRFGATAMSESVGLSRWWIQCRAGMFARRVGRICHHQQFRWEFHPPRVPALGVGHPDAGGPAVVRVSGESKADCHRVGIRGRSELCAGYQPLIPDPGRNRVQTVGCRGKGKPYAGSLRQHPRWHERAFHELDAVGLDQLRTPEGDRPITRQLDPGRPERHRVLRRRHHTGGR